MSIKLHSLISKVAMKSTSKDLGDGRSVHFSYPNNPKTLAAYINARVMFSFHESQNDVSYASGTLVGFMSDPNNPSKYGLIIHDGAPAMVPMPINGQTLNWGRETAYTTSKNGV